MENLKMRLLTCAEWDALVETTGGYNSIIHWEDMYSWCQDIDPDLASYRAVRGYYSARSWNDDDATHQNVRVGFRPAFECLPTDALLSDGALVTVGTLYMDGVPVRVPTKPAWDGDITDYISGAKLEFREPLEGPAYQVKAIKIGDVLIADRVLLKNISWDDIQKAQGRGGKAAENAQGGEVPTNKPKPTMLILNGTEYSFEEIAEKLGIPGPIRSVEVCF